MAKRVLRTVSGRVEAIADEVPPPPDLAERIRELRADPRKEAPVRREATGADEVPPPPDLFAAIMALRRRG